MLPFFDIVVTERLFPGRRQGLPLPNDSLPLKIYGLKQSSRIDFTNMAVTDEAELVNIVPLACIKTTSSIDGL